MSFVMMAALLSREFFVRIVIVLQYRACNNKDSDRIGFALEIREQIAKSLKRKRNNVK
jgi:hypothetical protein